jgi:phage tail-like protein
MAKARKFHKKYAFIVRIEGVGSAAFKSITAPRATINQGEHFEGGRAHPHKAPTTTSFNDITMVRGLTLDLDLYNWFKAVYDAASETGGTEPDVLRTVEIVQLDRDGSEQERWILYDAFVKEYGPEDWDNSSADFQVESAVIGYDHFERVPA